MARHLLIVHGATQGPFDEAAWLATSVGTRKAPGRLVTALIECTRLRLYGDQILLWIGTGTDDRPAEGPPRALEEGRRVADDVRIPLWKTLMDQAWIDTQSPNTLQECMNALEWAVSFGQGVDAITVISTPGHLPRCVRDACVAVAKHSPETQVRALASRTPFPTRDDLPGTQMPAIIDYPHVVNAPFAQVDDPAHHWNVLLPALFATFKGDGEKYRAFTRDMVALMKQHGVSQNIDGQPL